MLQDQTSGYKDSVSDIINRAKAFAKAIVDYQKEQRSAPYAGTLRDIGEMFAAADAKRKAQFNQQANKVRADYLASGGSPMDLPRELWGSDPSQGFQVGEGKFVPGYTGDNLSYGQKERLAALTGLFEGKPTFARQVEEAGLTGMYQGKPTFAREMAEKNYALDVQRERRLGAGASDPFAGLTQNELRNAATDLMTQLGLDLYEHYRTKGDQAQRGQPLFFTIQDLLRNPKYISMADKNGVSRKQVINNLIAILAGNSPEGYFSTGAAVPLKPLYEALAGKELGAQKDSLEMLKQVLGQNQ